MKHFIWMLCGIFVSGLLLGTLSACGSDQFRTAVITTAKQAPAPEAAPAPETEVPVEVQDEDTARRLAYGKALWDMYLLGLRPDGEELERASDLGPAEGNRFAVMDVNGDGAEELIIGWDQACMAGMQGLVYACGYPEEELRLILSEFPALTFYENGTAAADWSHSQGWAGRFWPITLYQYRPDSGVYEEIGSVDAWDLECTEGDETLAAAFPSEADADGNGLVYYILTGEWYQNDRTPPDGQLDGRLWETDPVDGAELEAWLSSCTGGTESLEIPYQDLTEENIAALGYPKPDVTYPEPVG